MRWCSCSTVARGRPTSIRLRIATPPPGGVGTGPDKGRPRGQPVGRQHAIPLRPELLGTCSPVVRSGASEPVGGSVHVVVVGCGRVGSELAGTLEKSGHTVAVIDKDANAFRRLAPGYAGQRVVGFGFDRDNLVEAGIERAGAVAAVTNGDNSNILVARIARESFGIERVVARIYDPRRAAIYQRLGIPTVATVSWTTDQVLRRLLPGEHPH